MFKSPVALDYSAEVFALGHRLGIHDVSAETLVQALTTESYQERNDVESGASGVKPSLGDATSELVQDHSELRNKGAKHLSSVVYSYLRYHLPKAPEDLIEAVAERLIDDHTLSQVGGALGVATLVRTSEHPVSSRSVADAVKATIGAMGDKRAERMAIDFIIPQVLDVDFCDVLPLTSPLAVLEALVKKDGVNEIEPRILRSAGVVSAQPVYVIGIYADKQLIGQSAGESMEIACDLAAMDGLLKLWGVTPDRVFTFNVDSSDLLAHTRQHSTLAEMCGECVDVTLLAEDIAVRNIVEESLLRYKKEIEPVVGRSYTRRLRGKFSRGSLAKRSFRYLVKPKVYTIA